MSSTQKVDEQQPSTSSAIDSNISISNITAKRNIHKKQKTLHDFTNTPLNVQQQKLYNNLVINFIVKDLQPFSVVEDEGFKDLISGLNPSYKLPSRTTCSRTLLNETYNFVLEKVKAEIAQAKYIT